MERYCSKPNTEHAFACNFSRIQLNTMKSTHAGDSKKYHLSGVIPKTFYFEKLADILADMRNGY